jgi:phosphopantothenoylcysteine decarboxylase/phosphopantothenate--cysteine ligase
MDKAILCAAVSDFTPASPATEKIKKEQLTSNPLISNPLNLSLKETNDIARALGERKQAHQQLIGFALETQDEKKNALHKLERKHLDAIILNSLRDAGAGFGTDTNRVTVLTADGRSVELPLQSKAAISEEILRVLFS